MLMSDIWIKERCQGDSPMISPFTTDSVSKIEKYPNRFRLDGQPMPSELISITSFGSSSYGYDLSLGNKFKVLRPMCRDTIGLVVDPCNFDQRLMEDVEVPIGEQLVIPPRGFALGVVREHLNIPIDIMGVCMEKSTIARCAIEVTVTPVEAGWRGYLTLEICNKTDYPAVLTAGMGITQLMFFKGDQPCSVPYHARNGKYQDQPAEPVIARMKD